MEDHSMIRTLCVLSALAFSSHSTASDYFGALGVGYSAGANASGQFGLELGMRNDVLPDYLTVRGGFNQTSHPDYGQYDAHWNIGLGKIFPVDRTMRFGADLSYMQTSREIARGNNLVDVACVNSGFESRAWLEGDIESSGYFRIGGGLRSDTGNIRCNVWDENYSMTDIQRQDLVFWEAQAIFPVTDGMDMAVYLKGGQRYQDHPVVDFYPDTDPCEPSETFNKVGMRFAFLKGFSVGIDRMDGMCGNEDFNFSIGFNLATDEISQAVTRLVEL